MKNDNITTLLDSSNRRWKIDYIPVPQLDKNEVQFMSPLVGDPSRVSDYGITNADEVLSLGDIQELYDKFLSHSFQEIEKHITKVLELKLSLYTERNPNIKMYSPRKKKIRFFSNILLKDIHIEIPDYELREWPKGEYFGRWLGKILTND